MDVYDAIRHNRSVRQFSSEPVSRDDIERIVNAGRLAGSAKNRQPWQFIVVTQRDTLAALSECGPWCTHLAGASFGVVMTVENLREPDTLSTPFDLGRASQNMILAGWEIGVMSCMATQDVVSGRSPTRTESTDRLRVDGAEVRGLLIGCTCLKENACPPTGRPRPIR